MKKFLSAGILVLAAVLLCAPRAAAWDYEVHRFVNQLALASLPTNYPAFARTPVARERIAFLAGEPDRWRNTLDLPLRHVNGPDHYFDLEDLAKYGLTTESLPPFRYEFVAQLIRGRAIHARDFPSADSAKDQDRTRSLIGFLPWAMTEYYAKLKSGFSSLRELEAAGTPEEVANERENIIYVMGVMGHFVGDASQPLHTTSHFNGWTGPNPNHYTTARSFHAWIDGGFLQKAGVKTNEVFAQVRPAKVPWTDVATSRTNAFAEMLAFVVEQGKLVEPLYQLQKDGKLTVEGQAADTGRAFLTVQLLKAGQMLGDLWLTAWQEAPPDTFLRTELARRHSAGAAEPKEK